MAWSVMCPTCRYRNSSAAWAYPVVLSRKPCARCRGPLADTIDRSGFPGTVRCSFVARPGGVCHRVAGQGLDLCEEHLAVVEAVGEEERQRRERAAQDLRDRVAKPPATEQLTALLEESLQQRRLAQQARLAEERRVAERAAARRLAAQESGGPDARRLLQERRLEAIIARRRWAEKRAWRKRSDRPIND